MAKFLFGPAPHDEAIDFIRTKPVLAQAAFAQLLPDLKARAFTVAGIECAETLQRVRDTVAELPAGGDWETLKAQIIEEVSPFFVTSDDPEERAKQEYGAERRAELLLRTHGQQAYAAASYKVMDAQRELFPAWQYQTLGDSRVRDTHAALDKVIMPADSPFWNTHFPPWDWGCRCIAIPLSPEDVEDVKEEDKQRPPEAHQWLDPGEQQRLELSNIIVRHADPAEGKGFPTPFNVQSPAEAGKPGAFTWQPGTMTMDPDELRKRVDPDIWAKFEKWSKHQAIADQKRTVWEWLTNQSPILPPGSPPNLPTPPPAATFADVLSGLGLDKKIVWQTSDVTDIMKSLKKASPVKATEKIASVTGAAMPKTGPLSAKGIRKAMREILNMLPPQIAKDLPKITIEIGSDASHGANLGYYDNTAHQLWLNHHALSKRPPEVQKETVYHEMMHWVHLHGPQKYKDAIAAHFKARTHGETPGPLPNYGSNGKPDKWYDAYAGRIYQHLGETGTEVPTRYFQLFANPDKFLRQMDPTFNQHAGEFLETVKTVMQIFV